MANGCGQFSEYLKLTFLDIMSNLVNLVDIDW